jgi:hypothetical protein
MLGNGSGISAEPPSELVMRPAVKLGAVILSAIMVAACATTSTVYVPSPTASPSSPACQDTVDGVIISGQSCDSLPVAQSNSG